MGRDAMVISGYRGAGRAARGPGLLASAAGVSLVETAVAIAVIGLVAAIAFPSLRGMVPRVRLANNVSILANEIALARRQAIAQSVDYSIVFDAGADTYTLRKRQGGAWQSLGTNVVNGSDLVGVAGFSEADTLIARAGGAVNVPPDVGGSPNYGYITLRTPDGSRARRIRVETLGRVVAER